MKNHKNKRMPVSVNDDSTNQIYVFKIVGKCLLNNLKKTLASLIVNYDLTNQIHGLIIVHGNCFHTK